MLMSDYIVSSAVIIPLLMFTPSILKRKQPLWTWTHTCIISACLSVGMNADHRGLALWSAQTVWGAYESSPGRAIISKSGEGASAILHWTVLRWCWSTPNLLTAILCGSYRVFVSFSVLKNVKFCGCSQSLLTVCCDSDSLCTQRSSCKDLLLNTLESHYYWKYTPTTEELSLLSL